MGPATTLASSKHGQFSGATTDFPDEPTALQIRRAVPAAIIGNVLEWFDFATYAFLAGAISRNFFPATDQVTSMLATFGAFGLGFVARPLGAVVFGWLGDAKGRKLALALLMPIMAVGTLLVGVIPSYAVIGFWAPVLLVLARLLQGFSTGGELGNAIAFLVEWAPRGRRGLYGSYQQCSVILGTLIGSGTAALLTTLLAPAAMDSWGWRVPFLIGGLIIGPIGWYIRRKVEDTPVYQRTVAAPASKDDDGEARSPILLAGQALGLTVAWTVSYYTLLNYLPTFTQKYAGISASTSLWSNTGGLLLMGFAIPLFGWLSDRIGRKPLLMTACIALIILPYPLFRLMLSEHALTPVILIQLLAGPLIAVFGGVAPAALSEIFPTRIRTTWMSIGYGIANAVFGGFAPFISIWLIARTGSPIAPTWYVIGAAIVSALTILTLRETAHERLR